MEHAPTPSHTQATQPRAWASFDDLSFVPAGLTRIPLENSAEKCSARTVLGSRHAERPLVLGIPLLIESGDALPLEERAALTRGAAKAGAASHTGSHGMLEAEREDAKYLVYGISPARCGISVHDLRRADAIELSIGQDSTRALGSLSPTRHPDMLGPDDMVIKIEELREATDWRTPIFVRLAASRVFDDVRLAAKGGADAIVVDGAQGGATGIPTLAAVCEARAALEEIGLFGTVQLIISVGIRSGVDAAKAMALGADAVCVGRAAHKYLQAQAPVNHADAEAASEHVASFLRSATAAIQALARACGKSDVHHLEPEDLRALNLESSLITGLPLAGTNRVVMGGPGWRK